MKTLFAFLAVVLFAASCSQSPTAVNSPNGKDTVYIYDQKPFTICNVMIPQAVDIYISIEMGGIVTPDSLLCSVAGGECKEVNVPDGTALSFYYKSVRYATIAHKGDFWNL